MKNQNEKADAPAAAKLTKEQIAILFTVEKHKYTAEELESLFAYFNKLNLPDFVESIDVHIMDYLGSTESISDIELTGLYNLYSLNRTLDEIASA